MLLVLSMSRLYLDPAIFALEQIQVKMTMFFRKDGMSQGERPFGGGGPASLAQSGEHVLPVLRASCAAYKYRRLGLNILRPQGWEPRPRNLTRVFRRSVFHAQAVKAAGGFQPWSSS